VAVRKFVGINSPFMKVMGLLTLTIILTLTLSLSLALALALAQTLTRSWGY
jgi:lipopolysaccharide export LptBFGC system permease protein LptF